MTFTTHSAAETEALAAAFAKTLTPGAVVAYRGGLGAGKTTFTRGLARGLGVTDDVSSPTFALVHEYRGDPPLVHFDMYRITTFDELYSTGFFDYLDGKAILAVEWSENVEEDLPAGTIGVEFEITGENERRITIKGGDGFVYPRG